MTTSPTAIKGTRSAPSESLRQVLASYMVVFMASGCGLTIEIVAGRNELDLTGL